MSLFDNSSTVTNINNPHLHCTVHRNGLSGPWVVTFSGAFGSNRTAFQNLHRGGSVVFVSGCSGTCNGRVLFCCHLKACRGSETVCQYVPITKWGRLHEHHLPGFYPDVCQKATRGGQRRGIDYWLCMMLIVWTFCPVCFCNRQRNSSSAFSGRESTILASPPPPLPPIKWSPLSQVEKKINNMTVKMPHQLFINGEFVDAEGGQTYKTINPTDGSVSKSFFLKC